MQRNNLVIQIHLGIAPKYVSLIIKRGEQTERESSSYTVVNVLLCLGSNSEDNDMKNKSKNR